MRICKIISPSLASNKPSLFAIYKAICKAMTAEYISIIFIMRGYQYGIGSRLL